MRHMAVTFGLVDGWMNMFYVPYWPPRLSKLLGGVGC